MVITTAVKQGFLIVRISGELDMHVADEFRRQVDNALDATGLKNILLSFENVTFIDSSGLGVILGRYKRISASGGKMLAACLQPQVAKIFELAGLLNIIRTYDSETEALECA
ncbi:anti-sigma F factor antagonist [Sporolituus thermophilus]|uniref:Anti-sigma F factor antagonist n=1 Tax=Sporolituus thermophilus DSM 23256 TaxID=1123285 RepID=A0A1G7JK17_9FIRM|nr:anti-sigma F factor antagonist [Sporolituus thermophilus]SDF25287.1 anti-anti-sigma regulatory factor, SpoIIAA [Sporolituus thermophilus DSM 23256]